MSSGINMVMAVIGFVLSTMFIVFVCTRLICARIQLIVTRRSLAMSNRSDLSILERGYHGLEPYVIANFPLKKYNDACLSSDESAQCTVCLAEYNADDVLRILPTCGHSFHATCIEIWLQQNSTCPVCRISLRGPSEKRRFMQAIFCPAARSQYRLQSLNANSCHCISTSDRPPSRSQYRPQSLNANSCHCISSSNQLTSRVPENQRMDCTQEEHRQSEGRGIIAGSSNSVGVGCQITTDSLRKQPESPSNL